MSMRLFVFICALAIRLALLGAFWDSLPRWEPDENGYQLLSIGLLKHQSFRRPFAAPDQPEHLAMPGYPFLMAAVYRAGVDPRRIFLLQCFLDALTAVLITGIIKRLRGSARCAVTGGVLYAIWPSASYFCMRLYVEPLMTFVVAAVFFIIAGKERWKTLWLSLLCASGIYIKPNFLLIAGITGALVSVQYAGFIGRQSGSRRQAAYAGVRRALLFACVVFFLVVPWVFRNKTVAGKAILSTVFATNLVTISAPYTLAELDGHAGMRPWTSLHCEYFFERFVAEVQRDHPEWIASLTVDGSNDFERLSSEAQNAWKLNGVHPDIPVFAYVVPAQLDAPVQTALRIAREHPAAFLKSHLRGVLQGWFKAKSLWFTDIVLRKYRSAQENSNPPGSPSIFPALVDGLNVLWAALYYAIILAAVGGAWRLAKYRPAMLCAIGATIVSITFLPGQLLNPRFMMPAIPLLLVLSSLALGSRGEDGRQDDDSLP